MSSLHLYSLAASRSIRIAWLLEELNLEWSNTNFPRVNRIAPPELATESGSSLGKSPVLKDGELTLVESGAICEYLVENYDKESKLLPTDKAKRAKVRTWLHAAEATFMIHALAIVYVEWGSTPEIKSSGATEHIQNHLSINVNRDLKWLEADLKESGGPYLVGDEVTLADIMMGFSIEFIFTRKLGVKGFEPYPEIEKWLKRCLERDAYKRAVEKTGYKL